MRSLTIPGGLCQVFGYAVGTAEIVEGPLRQHAERAAGEHGLVRHGIDGAVATGGHQDAAVRLGLGRHPLCDIAQLFAVVDDLEMTGAPGLGEYVGDGRAAQFGFLVAGAGVEDYVERSVRAGIKR
jgi:hypothetical protein